MVSTWLIVAGAAALFYYFIVKPYNYWTDRGVKQGRPVWILGDSWGPFVRLQSITDMIQYMYNQCPGTRYSGVYQFFAPTLLIRDPDLLKQVTVKDFDHFTDHRTFSFGDADPLWSRNLFSLTGETWREMRAILSPSFTSSKMRAIFVLIEECADNFVQHILKKDEEIVTLELKDTFTRFTNDVIATTAFGVKIDSLAEPKNEFFLMGKETTSASGFWRNLKFLGLLLFPKLFQIFKVRLFDAEVSDFFINLVNDTIKLREEKRIVRPDMINLLMEARKGGQKQEENGIIDTGFATAEDTVLGVQVKEKSPKALSNIDIAAQGLIFFFAGFDTVSTALCFASYELAVNQELQERLRKEVNTTIKETRGKLTYESLLKMKYMDMVISETLRKWPAAVATDRVCTKPYVIEPATPDEKPLYLEKGALISIPLYGIHRDPQYFPDPDRFDPERFNDENKGDIKPYTYFPFGLGPRNCIGSRFALLEIKALLFHILLHFEIVPVEKTPIPLKLSRKTMNLVPDGGFWLGLKRIKK